MSRPLTGTHLFQRERCRRHVWLEFHGDASRKLPPDPAAAANLARGRAHEQRIVARLDVVEPKYPRGDFAAGARETAALLAGGAPLVYQGVLAAEGRVGLPDLLRRDPGSGRYVVGDVKASAAPKVEHAMQVAFYSELLAAAQGSRPERAFLVLAGGREARVDLDEIEPLYREALADVEAIRAGRAEPRASHGPHCSGCPWRGLCIPEMEARGDLSLVFGVTPARREALEAAGVRGIAALAAADANGLAERTEIPRESLRRLRLQAAALTDGKLRPLGPLPWRPARIALAAVAVPDPRGTHFGEFLVYRTTRLGDRLEEDWKAFHAAEPEDEEAAYRSFLALLARDRDVPIYHYGPGLPDALATLDTRHGKLRDPITAVCDRLADVQAGLRTALVLPVRSYALDAVARALSLDAPAPPPLAAGAPPEEAAAAARRQAAAELLAIRQVRIAAQRAWRSQGSPAAPATTDESQLSEGAARA